MYFRRKKSPTGEVLQLIESYRNGEGKARNQVVVSLGDATIPREEWPLIAKAVESSLNGYQDLIATEMTVEAQRWVDSISKRVQRDGRWVPARQRKFLIRIDKQEPKEKKDKPEVIDGVLIDQVNHTQTSSLGPTLLGLRVWEKLGMPKFLDSLGFTEAQCDAAAVTVVNRLVDPVTENFLKENWLDRSTLPDLLGNKILIGNEKRFYTISDKLLLNQDAIEHHLRQAQERHFNLNRTLVLYDLTNTHFEGQCLGNNKAAYGRNKQKRHDCPQVVVGMLFDEFGFELGHRTFEGNMSDSKSLLQMVKELQEIIVESDSLALSLKPLVVVDAGIATKCNLKLLRTNGFNYLVNDSRRQRETYKDEFAKETEFHKIAGRCQDGQEKSPVKVKLLEEKSIEKEVIEEKQADGSLSQVEREVVLTEHLVLCKSDGRRSKELAMMSKAEERFLDQLQDLSKRLEKGRLKDSVKIERAVGRVKAKNPRVARFYEVTVIEEMADPAKGDSTKKKKKQSSKKNADSVQRKLKWSRNDDKFRTNENLLGCYVLRTDREDLTAEQYWQVYTTLTYAEDGFRALKSDLGLRPNHHRIEKRVDGHIFISILAYQLLHHILHTLRLVGDNRCWFTLRQVLETHCYTTIVVPTINGALYRLRKPGIPEESQKQIYNRFDITTTHLPTSKIRIEDLSTL